MGLAALLAAASGAAESPATSAGSLEISITGARSAKGVIRLALCPEGAGFPDCKGKTTRTADLRIENGKAQVSLAGLAPGNYAISLFHDANSNGKLDTFMGIPREGYGFSRNPPFRPRAPRFNEAVIAVSGETKAAIALRYLL